MRFQQEVWRRYRRNWVKRRYGYYEKPSELRRKRKKVKEQNRGRGLPRPMPSRRYNLHFPGQFQREGPFGFSE